MLFWKCFLQDKIIKSWFGPWAIEFFWWFSWFLLRALPQKWPSWSVIQLLVILNTRSVLLPSTFSLSRFCPFVFTIVCFFLNTLLIYLVLQNILCSFLWHSAEPFLNSSLRYNYLIHPSFPSDLDGKNQDYFYFYLCTASASKTPIDWQLHTEVINTWKELHKGCL